MPVPHPVPVPHPITLTKSVFVAVPKVITLPQSSHNEGGVEAGVGDDHASHETVNYNSYAVNVQGHGATHDQQNQNQAHFQPSQYDYSEDH